MTFMLIFVMLSNKLSSWAQFPTNFMSGIHIVHCKRVLGNWFKKVKGLHLVNFNCQFSKQPTTEHQKVGMQLCERAALNQNLLSQPQAKNWKLNNLRPKTLVQNQTISKNVASSQIQLSAKLVPKTKSKRVVKRSLAKCNFEFERERESWFWIRPLSDKPPTIIIWAKV